MLMHVSIVDSMNGTKTNSRPTPRWRCVLLLLSVFGPLVLLLALPPIRQPQEYYQFADRRALLAIPNFFDVTTNLAFLVVGILGLQSCLKRGPHQMRPAWLTLFLGLISVSAGSAYFHWNPGNDTLVWDRVSLTIGFAALFVALLGEYVSPRLGRWLLLPAVCLGAASVFYWHWSDDLRLYCWIQFMPLLAIPIIMVLFPSPYSHYGFLVAALVCYVAAKFTEVYDRQIFELTGQLFSGHSMKHLLAALGCQFLVVMLQRAPVKTAPR